VTFVWVRDFANRPTPQLWPEPRPFESDRVLATYEINPGEEDMPFDLLAYLYPPPAPKEAAA
jgi:hypothetical protein